MASPFLRLLILAFGLLMPTLLDAQAVVTLLNVKQPVSVRQPGGQVIENPSNGFRTAQGAVVTTGPGGGVLLVFSTGTTIGLSENASLTIETFTQAAPTTPPPAGVEDNTISKTRLTLDQGEIIGQVRKLRPESSFEVVTPIGVAGVRGTNIIIRVTRVNGQVTVSFGGDDGALSVLTLTGEEIEAAGISALEDGESLVLTGEQADDGTVTVTGAEHGTLTPDVKQTLERIINEQQDDMGEGGPNVDDGPKQPDPETWENDLDAADPTPGAGNPGGGDYPEL